MMTLLYFNIRVTSKKIHENRAKADTMNNIWPW